MSKSKGNLISVNELLSIFESDTVRFYLSFVNKKFDGKIIEGKIDPIIVEATKKSYEVIGKYLEKGEIKAAVTQMVEYFMLANKYYDSREPWKQVKENINDFNDTTYTCVYLMANMANLIAPVTPNASKKIKNILGLPKARWKEEIISGNYQINNLDILYNRIEENTETTIKKM